MTLFYYICIWTFKKNISPNHLGRYLYYFYRLFLDNLKCILFKNQIIL